MGKEVILIRSNHGLDEFEDGECKECEGTLVPDVGNYSLTVDDVVVQANNIPVYRCAFSPRTGCSGQYQIPEVVQDLLEQARKILEQRRLSE